MAGELMSYGGKIAAEYITGKAVAHTAAFDAYLALLTDYPAYGTTISAMAEVPAGIGYARPLVVWGAATTTDPAVISNTGLISFGALTADMPAPATALALVSVQVGTVGNALFRWTLAEPMQLLSGQALQIAPTKLTLSLT